MTSKPIKIAYSIVYKVWGIALLTPALWKLFFDGRYLLEEGNWVLLGSVLLVSLFAPFYLMETFLVQTFFLDHEVWHRSKLGKTWKESYSNINQLKVRPGISLVITFNDSKKLSIGNLQFNTEDLAEVVINRARESGNESMEILGI